MVGDKNEPVTMKCLHGMDDRFCTICHPLPKPPKKEPKEKRKPVPPGFAHATESIDPLSVPTFSDADPRGMHTTDGSILHRNGPGQAVCKVLDTEGRRMTCTIPRALWALAVSRGLREHATEDEDIVHIAAGCAAELTNDVGCRYPCTNVQHFKKMPRRSKWLDKDPEPCQNLSHDVFANHVAGDSGPAEAEAVLPVCH